MLIYISNTHQEGHAVPNEVTDSGNKIGFTQKALKYR